MLLRMGNAEIKPAPRAPQITKYLFADYFLQLIFVKFSLKVQFEFNSLISSPHSYGNAPHNRLRPSPPNPSAVR